MKDAVLLLLSLLELYAVFVCVVSHLSFFYLIYRCSWKQYDGMIIGLSEIIIMDIQEELTH
jgi:hypothetical protein